MLPAVALVVVVLYRRREWRGCQRLFWDSAAIGVGLWIVGYAGWVTEAIAFGSSGAIRPHTLVGLCGGIVPLIALLARPHLGVRSDAVTGVAILMASYALLAYLSTPTSARAQCVLRKRKRNPCWRSSSGKLAALAAGFLWVAWIGRGAHCVGSTCCGLGCNDRIPAAVHHLARSSTALRVSLFVDMAGMARFSATPGQRAPHLPRPGTRRRADVVPPLRPFWGGRRFCDPGVVPGWWLQPLEGNGDAFRALLTVCSVAGSAPDPAPESAGRGLQRTDARRASSPRRPSRPDLILITRGDGGVEHANEAFVRALGTRARRCRGAHSRICSSTASTVSMCKSAGICASRGSGAAHCSAVVGMVRRFRPRARSPPCG